jgi:hypothetical protein
VDAQQATQVLLRQVPSLDLQWQRFETVLASASSCGTQPEPPFSRVLLHQPHDPGAPHATPALWPARAVLRAAAQIRNGPWVDRTPFEDGDQTALLTTAAWNVADGAIGPVADTGTVTSLAIFGDADWRHFEAALEVDPGTGKAGVAAAVAGNNAVLFLIDGQAKRLQMVRRQAGVETELASAALSPDLQAPFRLEVTAYNDAWHASVGSAQVSQPRGVTDTGKLALAVRGAGRIRSLRVDPLDAYRFDFITSRYVDFAAHIGSCSGKIALLPQVADPGPRLERLLAAKPGADPAERQRAFDDWTAKLGIPLRREVTRLELSTRSLEGRVDLLLIESPEPLPFSEDVKLNMIHLQTKDRLRLAILSDGTESRAYVVPVAESGEPMTFEPGDYELIWSVTRNRYRGIGVDPNRTFNQQAKLTLAIEPAPVEPKEMQ